MTNCSAVVHCSSIVYLFIQIGTSFSSPSQPASSIRCCFIFLSSFLVFVSRILKMSLYSKDNMICPSHNNPLDFYCSEDKQFLCVVCRNETDHKLHNVKLAWDVFTQNNQAVFEKLGELQRVKTIALESKEQLKKREEEIIDQRQSIMNRITARIDEVVDKKLLVLQQQSSSVCILLERLSDCEDLLMTQRSSHMIVEESELIIEKADLVLREMPNQRLFEPSVKANIVLYCEIKTENDKNDFKSTSCILQVNEKASISLARQNNGEFVVTLSLPSSYGSLSAALPSQISCEICYHDNHSLPCVFKKAHTADTGVFDISFTPTEKGKHLLKVEIGFENILGSPFPLSIKGKPMVMFSDLRVPRRMCFNAAGDIIVAEWGGHQVIVINKNGQLVKCFGSKGTEEGQFTYPYGIAFSRDWHILVTDEHRLQKLTSSGDIIKSVGDSRPGDDHTHFNYPTGIAVQSDTGHVFVADSCNNRIIVFDNDLDYIRTISNQLKQPCDLAFDNTGNYLYIVDSNNHCIKKLSPSDNSILSVIPPVDSFVFPPSSIAIDSTNLVYVTERGCGHILIYDCDGILIDRVGGTNSDNDIHKCPNSVAVDVYNNLYITDTTANNIIMY